MPEEPSQRHQKQEERIDWEAKEISSRYHGDRRACELHVNQIVSITLYTPNCLKPEGSAIDTEVNLDVSKSENAHWASGHER
jgi:hypothetical protein